jgi:FKBP-type peptidyl-prolyl cis-trans isomerase
MQKTDKDSVLINSFTSNQPATIQIRAAQNVADLMDFFPLLSANDSAFVVIPTDSIFKNEQMQRPPFLPKGSKLLMTLKVNRVQSMEEAMAEYQKKMDEMKAAEATSTAKYLADNKITGVKTASGLRYIIRKSSVKAKPVKGDTVFVNYIGRTLDGKIFDTSIEAEAKQAGIHTPGRPYEPLSLTLGEGRVIPGWEEGLLLLNEGAKATFIIPSSLAYGERGAGADIAPFSTLAFDVELVKVKKAKKTAVPAKKITSTAKPAAKKATSAKPAAKPASKAPAKTTTKKN